MKKILFLTVIAASFCFANAEQTLQQKLQDTCKKMQIQEIADAKKAALCLRNEFILKEEMITKNDSNMLGTGYLIVGAEQGKCHYKKVNSISFTKTETLGDCYAPMSVMQNYANDRINYANKMCSNNGFADVDDSIPANIINLLESYCK